MSDHWLIMRYTVRAVRKIRMSEDTPEALEAAMRSAMSFTGGLPDGFDAESMRFERIEVEESPLSPQVPVKGWQA